MAHDLFRLRLEFKGNISGSVLPFQTKSALNRWSLLNFMLTLNGTDLGEEYDTKVVYNYDTFPVSIYTSLSDKWSRSNDIRKSRVLLEIPVFWTNRRSWSIWSLSLYPSRTEETQTTKSVGGFSTIPRRGIAPNFDTRPNSSRRRKLGRFWIEIQHKPLSCFFSLSGFQFYFLMKYEDAMPWQHAGPIHFSPKEKLLPNIDVICVVGGKTHSSP
jgi:hypothetical protein